MKNWNRIARLAGAALALGLLALPGRLMAVPLMHDTFEDGDDGWQGLGGAKISVTNDAGNVKEGKGALQVDYNVAKGEFNTAILATPNGALTDMKSMKFWIKADHETPIYVVMQEQGGGRYNAMFNAPKDKWQEVQLSPSDFILGQMPNDPKDPDNKLDLDQIQGIGIVDLSEFFAQNDNAALASLFNIQPGPHRLFLDNFVVDKDPLEEPTTTSPNLVALDRFVHPQISWICIGGGHLSRSDDKPLDGPGLRLDYHQTPGKILGLLKPIVTGRLTGMEQLAFTVVSSQPAKLLVQVEETSGGKYNTIVQVPEGTTPQHIRVNFADFTASDDSKDDDNKLDLDQVKQILMIDASGLIDQADQDNTLWINHLYAAPPKTPDTTKH